jgi:hypothetical protein
MGELLRNEKKAMVFDEPLARSRRVARFKDTETQAGCRGVMKIVKIVKGLSRSQATIAFTVPAQQLANLVPCLRSKDRRDCTRYKIKRNIK